MPSCPECENNLDLEIEEVEEGDGVEPLELARVGEDPDEDEDAFFEEEEEEE
jgi:alpha-aminoadipate carrier protein LysW